MSDSLEFRLLRYTVAVADTANLTRAAERLYLAQPSLSKQIKDLEEEIKFPIFHRDRSGVHVTPAGDMVLAYARETLKSRDELLAMARAVHLGEVPPLRVGFSAFVNAGRLLTDVRAGTLLVTNNGPEGKGFVLCPTCGREVDPNEAAPHRRPVNVPPLYGPKKGPQAGTICPAKAPWTNELVLVHPFHSEVLLLGVDLPKDLDASFVRIPGRAFGTPLGPSLLMLLQRFCRLIPGELRTGVRPVRKPDDRLHAEVFLYDDVPGGAGYARRLRGNLDAILGLAMELGSACVNPLCESGCYRCIFDDRNQGAHSKLDRPYGTDLLRFVVNDARPVMDAKRLKLGLDAVREYARGRYEILPGYTSPFGDVPVTLRNKKGKVALWPIHPLAAVPSLEQQSEIKMASGDKGTALAIHDLFDMERRPFWVVDQLSLAE